MKHFSSQEHLISVFNLSYLAKQIMEKYNGDLDRPFGCTSSSLVPFFTPAPKLSYICIFCLNCFYKILATKMLPLS